MISMIIRVHSREDISFIASEYVLEIDINSNLTSMQFKNYKTGLYRISIIFGVFFHFFGRNFHIFFKSERIKSLS